MASEKIPIVSLNNPVSRRDFMKGMGAIGILTVGGPMLAACAAPPPDEPEDVRTQFLWIKNSEFNGFYAADIKGFYEEEGIAIDLLAGGPGVETMQIMDAKQAEVGLHGSGSSFINAVIGGSKNRVFAAVFQRSPAGLMYLADNPIATPQDAIGKRIGLQPGATQGWQVICAQNDLDCENDMEIVSVSWDPSVLVDGTVDGYWCYATNQPGILRLQGYDVGVLDPWDWGLRSYGNFAIAHEDYFESNMDTLVGWLRASIRGWVYANNNIEEITQYTVDTFGPDYDLSMEQQVDEATAQIDYMVSDLTEEKGLFWFDKDVWEVNQDQLAMLGELEEADRKDADELSTYEVLEEVYKDGIDEVYKPAMEM
jgi:ABC-type nitrate/sulfonate/bicarbonate transport system substrate-binding protein